VITRPATSDDFGFVVETFTKTFRRASTHAEGLENEQCGQLLMNLVSNGWSATVAEQDGKLIGWAVHAPKNRLGWVYVSEMVRGQGVCRYLLKQAEVQLTRVVTTPFHVNRGPRPPFRCELRPFLCIASEPT